MSLADPKLTNAPRGVYVEKPKFNIYTMMLLLSLIAIGIGCLCLYGEMSRYDFDFKAKSAQIAPM